MRITSLRLQNYRCFADSGVMPICNFCLFIGRNDGGKSSAILALYKLLGGEPFENDDHRKEPIISPDEQPFVHPEMIVNINLIESEMEFHYRCIRRISSTNGAPEVLHEIESTDCVEQEDLNQDFDSLTLESLKALCMKYTITPRGPANQRASFITSLDDYRMPLARRTAWIPASKAFRSRLPKVFLYSESNESNPEQTIKKTLNEFYRNSILPDHQERLDGFRADVEQRLNERARDFVSVLREHCTTVENISVDLAGSSFESIQLGSISITQTGGTAVDWSRIGRGKKREMSLAVFHFMADLLSETLESNDPEVTPSIVALFDEPDLNLDYDAQRRISERLQKLSRYAQCQVLVSTHSGHLINGTTLKHICFFDANASIPATSHVISLDPGDDTVIMDVLRESMGLGNSLLFNEKLFVVCEGATELGTIPSLYGNVTGNSLSLAGIYLINGQNCDDAKHIAGVLRKNGRKVHLLLDNDCTVKPNFTADKLSRCHLNISNDVTFIGSKEFEDVFPNDVWVDALNMHCPKADDAIWSDDDIATARAKPKFSEAITQAIALYSVQAISKPELGRYLALVATETSRIPDELVGIMRRLQERAQEV